MVSNDISIIGDWHERVNRVCIAVWGDLCLDRYRYGSVRELAREAPVAALHLEREVLAGGQAANVALNVKALGAEVIPFGITGNDAEGKELLRILKEASVNISRIISTKRPTELREKLVAGSVHQPSQHLMHVYRESYRPLPPALSRQFLTELESDLPLVNLLIMTDYGNGMCLGKMSREVLELCRASKKPCIANTRRSINHFVGASGMVINSKQLMGRKVTTVISQLQLEWLLVTEGARGMNLYYGDQSHQVPPPNLLPVRDITGAGDTVLAWMAAGLAAGFSAHGAIEMANLAAQAAIAMEGTAAPTYWEVRGLLR